MITSGLLTKRFKLPVLFGFAAFAMVLLWLVGAPGRSFAMSPNDIPASVAPYSVRSAIDYRCDVSGWNVVQIQWISPNNAPSATSMTVAYGTGSVALQLNYITYRCPGGSSSLTKGSFKITDTDPNISSLIGLVADMPYVSAGTSGYRSGELKNFTYSGPFTSSRTVTIYLETKGTISMSGGRYYCAVVSTEPQVATTSAHNFDPISGYCKIDRTPFSVNVNVTNPATLDGVKIDDKGYDATLRPYGGNLGSTANYYDLPVSVTTAGSDTRNPFFFSSGSGGGTPISIAVSGSSVRTVSVNLSTLPANYDLIGYSICYTGQTTKGSCTANNMDFGGSYFVSSTASSFNYTMYSGRSYHVRWVFRYLPAVSCGSFITTPSSMDSATRFRATASVKFGATYTPLSPTVSLTFSPAIPTNANVMTATSATGTLSQSGTVLTASYGGNALQLGPTGATGQYTATWVYDDASLTPTTCKWTFSVANKPYTAVYGGDVVIGEAPTTETTCYTDEDGGAYGWNNYASDFKGAGSQYAVMAMGTIQEFASSLGTTTPDKLAFANVDYGPANAVHNVATGLYGGMFGATNTPCDFLSDIDGVYPLENGPGPTSSFFNVPAGTPKVIGAGQTVKYAEGNVYIANNVVYSGSGAAWANLAAIPSLKLVVKGDIYIDNNVTQLDGIYVALTNEDGTSGGNIFTCATSIGNDVKPATPNFYDDCHTKLTVNGAFIARQVHLLRTIGTLGQSAADTPAANNAAEVFNYTPELWLPRGAGVSGTGRWMSITGLPPVL